MQSVRDYADTHGITIGELFDLAWRMSHFGQRCRDDSVVKDTKRYEKRGVIPYYVAKYLKQQSQLPTMPKGVK